MNDQFQILLILFLVFASGLGCGESYNQQKENFHPKLHTDTLHTSQNALDWPGRYSGTLPCASCPGIETTLILYKDGTYQLTMHYLEEAEPNTIETTGTFSWDDNGQIITLENEEVPNQYFVGENYLAKLNINGKRIKGELADKYLLRK